MNDTETAFLMTTITQTIEKHGCHLVNIDIENQIIELEGPEENKTACALAIAELLG